MVVGQHGHVTEVIQIVQDRILAQDDGDSRIGLYRDFSADNSVEIIDGGNGEHIV